MHLVCPDAAERGDRPPVGRAVACELLPCGEAPELEDALLTPREDTLSVRLHVEGRDVSWLRGQEGKGGAGGSGKDRRAPLPFKRSGKEWQPDIPMWEPKW